MTNAKEYGRALFLLSEEDGTTAAVAEELDAVRKILREHPRYEKLLDTPALSKEEKLLLIDRAFSSLNENLVNLLKILWLLSNAFSSSAESQTLHRNE